MGLVVGKRYYDDDMNGEEEAKQFRELISEIFGNAGTANLKDYLAILRWINDGKLAKKAKELAERTHKLFTRLIDKHQQRKDGLKIADTMINHLLSLQESQPNFYTNDVINGLTMVVL
ncbi:hypothetical protein JCGZ_22239 [Jatropha curcas]|uniref:Cytochrome P450 n=1 Tax=Jatropha curcas TaxID=180498 RepID=A0A067JTJ3_JATCU|nr:hypothetical protein JCGZ_22239 [Jatropha curcas]